MLLYLWRRGPAQPGFGAWHIILAIALAVICNFAVVLAMRPASRVNPVLVGRFTAVTDPLLLSLALMLLGETGQPFACLYLLAILGFGFRIGAGTMVLCQAASISGFIVVALLTPAWRQHPWAALSVLLTLFIVPLYAKFLIAGLQRASDHAEAESCAKTRLLANVSHELRTPLTGIVSCAHLIDQESNDPLVRMRCDTVLALSQELMGQINNLLDSAKYGADALQLESAPFRMTDVAAQLRRALAATALTKSVALRVDVDRRIAPCLTGDAFHLGRVLLNLGSNALKFTEQGEVQIGMSLLEESPAACHVRFSCRDTGIGIAPEFHQKIFEPFFQAPSGANRRHGGTGLGMSIVQEILKAMGSRLAMSSVPGRGSAFEFELWLQKAPEPEGIAHEGTEAVRSRRILVADDSRTNLALIRQLLERDSHQVVTAENGRSAIALLNAARFDLAILDFNMSDLDGASVLQLHRFGTLEPVPIYILTADNSLATARRLIDGGAAGVLHKPIDPATLRQAIDRVPGVALPPAENTAAVQYIDQAAIADLRELGNDPGFLEHLLGTAAADLETLCGLLSDAILRADLTTTWNKAHALKGISVSVGAVQLASIATRLTCIAQDELQRDGATLAAEVGWTAKHSIHSLRSQMLSRGN